VGGIWEERGRENGDWCAFRLSVSCHHTAVASCPNQPATPTAGTGGKREKIPGLLREWSTDLMLKREAEKGEDLLMKSSCTAVSTVAYRPTVPLHIPRHGTLPAGAPASTNRAAVMQGCQEFVHLSSRQPSYYHSRHPSQT
jgi:hypothetical protein